MANSVLHMIDAVVETRILDFIVGVGARAAALARVKGRSGLRGERKSAKTRVELCKVAAMRLLLL